MTVDEAATLKASALRDSTHPFQLLTGSKLGTVLARTTRTQLSFVAKGARTVALRLRIPYALLKPGHVYRLLVTAKSADGQSGKLLIQFRR